MGRFSDEGLFAFSCFSRNGSHPTQIAFRRRTDVGCWSQGQEILPTLGRRWADVGLPTTTRVRCLNILPTLGQRWANGGFLFKMGASNNRGFGETYKKIIYYGMSKNHISVSPKILSNHLIILDIKLVFSL